jgi:starch-binding outer membrane protein, SusD/RagB family
MKNTNILFALFCLIAPSCSKFLDETSPNDLDSATAIRDARSAEAALTGIYSSMQGGSYYGGEYLLIGEALSDNAATGGYSALSLDQIGANAVTPANVIVESMWIAIYRTVANCNYLLAALPGVNDLDADRKKAIEGETRAIRALAHFDLLRYFGEHWDRNSAFGIPLVTSVQSIEDKPARATTAQTYTFIIGELEAALGLVGRSETPVQYINAASIEALLARVYLYQGSKTKAAEFASKVIANDAFSLLDAASYSSIYTKRRTSESVFELSFDAQNRSDYNGQTYSRDDAIRPELSYMSDRTLDAFFKSRPGDVRAAMHSFDPSENDATIIPDGRTQKYRGENTRDNPAYIIRLAEMKLIRAEALGRNNAGLTDLNALRLKRGLPELADAGVPTDDAFLNAVLDERRAELNFEGHRYFDLARTRKIKETLGVDEFRGALPIPAREISASGGAIKQTPGY